MTCFKQGFGALEIHLTSFYLVIVLVNVWVSHKYDTEIRRLKLHQTSFFFSFFSSLWLLYESVTVWAFRVSSDRFCALETHLVDVLLYVHRNRRFIRDGKPRTSTATFTQLLNSEYIWSFPLFKVDHSLSSTHTHTQINNVWGFEFPSFLCWLFFLSGTHKTKNILKNQ